MVKLNGGFKVFILGLVLFSVICCVQTSGDRDENSSHSGVDDEYTWHINTLKKKIPHPDFTVIVQKPFVVIGDGPRAEVELIAKNVVKWAVEKLRHMYFKLGPEDIIDIWLFNGKESYMKHTWDIFQDKPATPYGYSSPKHKALIMNIQTGTGTLVHEIVHPFIRTNFPNCPAWFNEGLASLYEQCTEKGKLIIGLTNWRLPGLQDAIKERSLPSFKQLTATSEYEFYKKDPGTNYAQARYLCYYLQEKNRLIEFYHLFQKNQLSDPTGYRTLQQILGVEDMNVFQKEWQKFILKLEFR